MPDAATLGLLATALGFGFVSAVTPFLPVEAYVLAVAATNGRGLAVVVSVLAAVGHTAGKVVLFEGTRSAARWPWLTRLRARAGVAGRGEPDAGGADVVSPGSGSTGPSRAGPGGAALAPAAPATWRGRWRAAAAPLAAWLRRVNAASLAGLSGRWGPLVVFSAGLLGLPPLLVVVFWAGASSMSLRAFTLACLLGRTLRFAALAAGVSLVTGLWVF